MKKRTNDKKYRKKFHRRAIRYNKKYPIEDVDDVYIWTLFRLVTDVRFFYSYCNIKNQPLNLKVKWS